MTTKKHSSAWKLPWYLGVGRAKEQDYPKKYRNKRGSALLRIPSCSIGVKNVLRAYANIMFEFAISIKCESRR